VTPDEVIGAGVALVCVGVMGVALVRASYAETIVVDPGRAWARKVCQLADAHRGYRSTVIEVRLEQLGEEDWEIVLPDGPGDLAVARVRSLQEAEELLTTWWHSPPGRRSLFRIATRVRR
jgi:hypothetical protein